MKITNGKFMDIKEDDRMFEEMLKEALETQKMNLGDLMTVIRKMGIIQDEEFEIEYRHGDQNDLYFDFCGTDFGLGIVSGNVFCPTPFFTVIKDDSICAMFLAEKHGDGKIEVWNPAEEFGEGLRA